MLQKGRKQIQSPHMGIMEKTDVHLQVTQFTIQSPYFPEKQNNPPSESAWGMW